MSSRQRPIRTSKPLRRAGSANIGAATLLYYIKTGSSLAGHATRALGYPADVRLSPDRTPDAVNRR